MVSWMSKLSAVGDHCTCIEMWETTSKNGHGRTIETTINGMHLSMWSEILLKTTGIRPFLKTSVTRENAVPKTHHCHNEATNWNKQLVWCSPVISIQVLNWFSILHRPCLTFNKTAITSDYFSFRFVGLLVNTWKSVTDWVQKEFVIICIEH